jgi:heterodisulfide reductase subunit B
VDDSHIRAMVTYVVKYFSENCPENLDAMVHLIGHDERFRKRVEAITEEVINDHDELFVACSSGKKVEDLAPKYATQCKEIRSKMRQLVNEYLSECQNSN